MICPPVFVCANHVLFIATTGILLRYCFLKMTFHVKMKWMQILCHPATPVIQSIVSLGGAFGVAEKNKVTVTIHNRTYTIVGNEPEEHVKLVARLVDEKMQEIYEANKHLDSTKLAVLTALNTMNDYIKLKEEHEELLKLLEEEK